LANNKITLSAFRNEIKKIESNSYDPKQLDVLKSIQDLALEISSQN